MEIKILEQDKNKIEFEVIGEDHTLCNAVRNELWSFNETDVSAYRIDHSLISEPIMLVESSKGDAINLVVKANDSLKKKIKDFKDQFNKNIK
ncbi:DNA-directed RNA polymerase subunit L [archaeon]|nr:DNA-directed RNA polymerase subunit L [archaeon]|tara:strand:+ start:19386 stop:19661 length:276 start_codon:yes stop_codon:yes gene_type:complete